MPHAPRVSFVIPTHNRAGLIGRAVQSALAQTFDDIEVIVIDDGSEDETPVVLARIADPRLRVVRHARNRGIPAARNSGLEAARGDYLAWLDSDDVARPHRIEQQLRFLEARPDIAMIGCCAGILRTDGRGRGAVRVPPLTSEQIEAWLLFRSPFQQSALMGRTAILRAYPYDEAYPVGEDLDMFLRLTREHRTANLPLVLIDRLVHPGQITLTDYDAVDAHKIELLRPALVRLGLSFDAADMDRHLVLARSGRLGQMATPDFLCWADGWLRRLLAANEATHQVSPSGLRFAASFFWLRACLAARKRSGWRRTAGPLARSSLSAGLLSGEGRHWAASALRVAMAPGAIARGAIARGAKGDPVRPSAML